VSDPLLILSTSKAAAESLSAELGKLPPPAAPAAGKDAANAAGTLEGAVWRFDPDALLTWLNRLGSLSPDQSDGDTEKADMVFRWLKPFHVMEGRLYQEEKSGQWRTRLDWEMADVVKFD
jgi:hypothetical protein